MNDPPRKAVLLARKPFQEDQGFAPRGAATSRAQRKVNTPTVFRYCIALKNALFFRQPSGVELCPIFDKRATTLSSQPESGW
jgi:hypothetical protein